MIYSGLVGFDLRLSSGSNFYGRGVYFAERAVYSEGRYSYATKTERGGTLYQMLVARVLLGHVKDFGLVKAPQLKRPPERTQGRLFDSLRGGPFKGVGRPDAAKSSMCVVYNNTQALAQYIVTYSKK